jgi:hypothetical protein
VDARGLLLRLAHAPCQYGDAQIAFFLESKTAEGSCEVNIDSYLYPFQRAWLLTPDLMVQFAHHVADEYRKRGADVAVYAWTDVSLNDRTPRLLVDPKVDLASVSRTLGHHSWLRDRDDTTRLERPQSQPCPDPLPLERIRQIQQTPPQRID